MFTLRHSDPRTVLLWGNRWWLPGREAPAEFGDLGEAVEVLAAAFTEEPKPVRLRIIYQPDILETSPVACPHGNRMTIATALAAEFPALGDPKFAWGHEPVHPHQDGYVTLLHFEKDPALFTLARDLAQRGFAVESAWPLPTWLSAVPREWSESGALTVVAVSHEQAVAYHHPRDGQRCVLTWRGETTLADVGTWLRQVADKNAGDPVLVIAPDHDIAARLETFVASDLCASFEVLRLGEVLRQPVTMPHKHPAQLLPRQPFITAEQLVIAASVALFLTAAVAGAWHGWQATKLRAVETQQAREIASLRSEVAHLRENAREISLLRRELSGGTGGPPVHALLECISRTVPADLALSKIRVDGRAIILEGWTASGAAPAVDSWNQGLAQQAPWVLAVQPQREGAFRLAGEFHP